MHKTQNLLALAVLAVAGAAVLGGADHAVRTLERQPPAAAESAAPADAAEATACPCVKAETEAAEEAATLNSGNWSER